MTETVKISNTGYVLEVSVNNSNPTSEFQNIQVTYRLNGKNYLRWSQLVRTFLKGRGKLSHLLGTGPKEGDPKFDAWDEQDSMEEQTKNLSLRYSGQCESMALSDSGKRPFNLWLPIKPLYPIRDS
ncbi:hypothetical protein PVK06_006967 [Gossypium arboreum]|uniref:Retrotransposon Copia-like N-terminal domain-containing protein n=1 Tax=Gossypium arboreum TaxID=29729 RepID=A0ABR0QG00_GOSAR|nr:hypothetical protein PVK06_006967 [Gossypium arboreum]